MLLTLSLALVANPVPIQFVSELWFDESGDLHAELCSNYAPMENLSLRCFDGTNYETLPNPISIPGEMDIILMNLSQSFPSLDWSPTMGELEVAYSQNGEVYDTVIYCVWNPNWRPELGQSFVAVYDIGAWFDSAYLWTKEQPPTPGTYPFYTCARAPLNITCLDQFDNPVPNAAVWVYSNSSESGHTDAQGFFATECMCHNIKIQVFHPQTNELCYDQFHSFEPDVPVNITVSMYITENDDMVLPSLPIKGLEVFPNPFIAKHNDRLTLRFDGDQKILTGSSVIVYNIRGQEISRIEMQANEEKSWIPERSIPSGTYLMKLTKGDKTYGSQVLKIIR